MNRFRLWRVSARRPGWSETTPLRCSYFPTRADARACAKALRVAGWDVDVDRADCTVAFVPDAS